MQITDLIYEVDPTPIPEEWLWERIRLWRDRELAATDWTQTVDAPVDKTVWAAYRQALRDLPASNPDPFKVVFPTKP